MILLHLLKINFSLIGKGFSNECGLDPLNLKSTNELLENFSSFIMENTTSCDEMFIVSD